ncbi:uncharacterized protein LOC141900660 [Tubulanus polymorphus]|uniref:uncharacterized protein LOC141900660 n=1 Tax=Tubulanus polymorphus TaxID=672921 RepID=UPI003DA5E4E4
MDVVNDVINVSSDEDDDVVVLNLSVRGADYQEVIVISTDDEDEEENTGIRSVSNDDNDGIVAFDEYCRRRQRQRISDASKKLKRKKVIGSSSTVTNNNQIAATTFKMEIIDLDDEDIKPSCHLLAPPSVVAAAAAAPPGGEDGLDPVVGDTNSTQEQIIKIEKLDLEKENKMVNAARLAPPITQTEDNSTALMDRDSQYKPSNAKRQKLSQTNIKIESENKRQREPEREKHSSHRRSDHHRTDRQSDHHRSHRRSDHHRHKDRDRSNRHGNCSNRHGDCSNRHGDRNNRHGDRSNRHGDCSNRHGDQKRCKPRRAEENSVKLEDLDLMETIKEECLYDDEQIKHIKQEHRNTTSSTTINNVVVGNAYCDPVTFSNVYCDSTIDDMRYCDSPVSVELYKNGEIDPEVFKPLETKINDFKNNNIEKTTSSTSTTSSSGNHDDQIRVSGGNHDDQIHVSVKVEKNSEKSKIEVKIDDKLEKSSIKVAIDVNREDKLNPDINLEQVDKPGLNQQFQYNKDDNIFSRIGLLHHEPIRRENKENEPIREENNPIVIDDDELPDLDVEFQDESIFIKTESDTRANRDSIDSFSSIDSCDAMNRDNLVDSFGDSFDSVSYITRMFEYHMCFSSAPTSDLAANQIPIQSRSFEFKHVSAIEACLEEGYECLDHACSLLLDFTTVARRPSEQLTNQILTDILINCPDENQSIKTYETLKRIERLHPSRSRVPFTFEFIDQCVTNVSTNQKPSLEKLNNLLAVDFCVCCVENELMNRKLMSQRDICKSVAHQWFNDTSFSNTRKLISWLPLAISVDRPSNRNSSRQSSSPRKRMFTPFLLPLILKLLEISVMVNRSPVEGADRIARRIVQDMNTWQTDDRRKLLDNLRHSLLINSLVKCLLDLISLDSISDCIREQLEENRDSNELALIVLLLVESTINIESGQLDLQLSKRMMKLNNPTEMERPIVGKSSTRILLSKVLRNSLNILRDQISSVYVEKMKILIDLLSTDEQKKG